MCLMHVLPLHQNHIYILTFLLEAVSQSYLLGYSPHSAPIKTELAILTLCIFEVNSTLKFFLTREVIFTLRGITIHLVIKED